MLTYLFSLVIVVSLLFYYYTKWAQSYWKRKGVEYLEPTFFYGNMDLIEEFSGVEKPHFSEVFAKFYHHFKSKGKKFGGVYSKLTPVLIPTDLKLIKAILKTDFATFPNSDRYINVKSDPLSGNLIKLRDENWKNMRAKLTPTFTTGKLKMMSRKMIECTLLLEKNLQEHAALNNPVDSKELFWRFTTDIIASVAFGLSIKSLEDPDSKFRKHGNYVNNPPKSLYSLIKKVCVDILPYWLSQSLNIKVTDKEVEDFFLSWVKNLVEYRERNNIHQQDFLHLLIQLKNMNTVTNSGKLRIASSEKTHLTIEEIAAQCYSFFVAGTETSISTMSFALLHLALNKEIQEKARKEIDIVLAKYNNETTYDALKEMKYLEQIISETLRIDSTASVIRRECNKNYMIPGTDIIIGKGTVIRIPIHGFHHDPEYFPDPKKFDPDRFSDENKSKIPQYAFLPFGEGPRLCIGVRFGKLESKMGLCAVLKNYKVTLNKNTKLPIRIDSMKHMRSVEGGLWFDLEKV